MKKGLMWYDDSPGRTLNEKVSQAAGKYKEKNGKKATAVKVKAGTTDQKTAAGLLILHDCATLAHHFLIGRLDEKKRHTP